MKMERQMNARPPHRLFARPVEVLAATTRLEDFEDFAFASARRQAIRAERVDIEAEITHHEMRLAAEETDDVEFEAAARAHYLGEGRETGSEPKAEIERLRRRLEVVRRSERIAKEALDEARDRRSVEVCRAFQPAHRAAVRNIARLLGELSNACREEAEIRTQVSAGGVTSSSVLVPPMSFPSATMEGGPYGGSPAATWIATARQLGFLGPDESLDEIQRGARS